MAAEGPCSSPHGLNSNLPPLSTHPPSVSPSARICAACICALSPSVACWSIWPSPASAVSSNKRFLPAICPSSSFCCSSTRTAPTAAATVSLSSFPIAIRSTTTALNNNALWLLNAAQLVWNKSTTDCAPKLLSCSPTQQELMEETQKINTQGQAKALNSKQQQSEKKLSRSI
eukprot:m.85604 g.85604  ORF g.85604 m.85604 type:complete len:173 (-) comp14432_c0_seq2:378-896(-)